MSCYRTCRIMLLSAALLPAMLPKTALAMDAPQLAIEIASMTDSLQLQLSWNEIAGASEYKLFRQQDGAVELLLETAATSATVMAPLGSDVETGANTNCQFYLTAVGGAAGPVMILVPAGTFQMGRDILPNSYPVHQVTLTNDYYLGQSPVTNAQFLEALQWALDNGAPGGLQVSGAYITAYGKTLVDNWADYCELEWSGDEIFIQEATNDYATEAYPEGYDPTNHPVQKLTWFGAACYCDWRSMMEGLTPFYQGDWTVSTTHNPYTAEGYRLPTEAEWERAAHYNDARLYPWGGEPSHCNYLNHFQSGEGTCVGWTTPVGSYPAYGYGFVDLAGNVREWCNDYWNSYAATAVVDPLGTGTSTRKVTRGCGWPWNGEHAFNAFRDYEYNSVAEHYVGMRVARTASAAVR